MTRLSHEKSIEKSRELAAGFGPVRVRPQFNRLEAVKCRFILTENLKAMRLFLASA